MIHTDRVSQYCAHSFRTLIKQHGLTQSMSRKGNCWENKRQRSVMSLTSLFSCEYHAVAESFFATLKKQGVHAQTIKPLQQMRQLVSELIEIDYNRVRRHSANDWQTPVEFERLSLQSSSLEYSHAQPPF